MKIVMPGGSGHVGQALRRHLRASGHEVIVLSRRASDGEVAWDGKTLGPWVETFEGADAVINLAGRSVNCRYNAANLTEMMDSRVDSTRVVGEAISKAKVPPRVWLQASTATIYRHTFGPANDDDNGVLGGDEPNAPPKWVASIEIAKAWEAELAKWELPRTRKIALRSAMTMSPDKGSVFDVFATLASRGLLGRLGSGKQYVSWIHEVDFGRAIEFLIESEDLSGPINVSSPNPLPSMEFNRILRWAVGAKVGVPAPAWLLEIATLMLGTETELILKSRRVVPSRLLKEGFEFRYPTWEEACAELVSRWRNSQNA